MRVEKKQTLSVSEAAALLGISAASVYRLARARRMPGAVRIGGRVLISRPALERLLGTGNAPGSKAAGDAR